MSSPPPASHGGDGARLARALGVPNDEVLDLSASLNPVAPSLRPLLLDHLDAVGRYPDDHEATQAVAEMLGVHPDLLVLTNGGAEAIALVAQLEPVGSVVEPEFSLYRRHLSRVDDAAPRWRSNPNNPTGVLAEAHETARVWDEAFYVLATGEWTCGDSGDWRIGSLTKAFACPGLRIGFVIAPSPERAQRLAEIVPRWSFNGLAAAVTPSMVALADPRRWAREIADLRGALAGLLDRYGLAAAPSSANYVVVPGAVDLRSRLAGQGVLVRDLASFGLRGCRIAVPDESGLATLATALDAIHSTSALQELP